VNFVKNLAPLTKFLVMLVFIACAYLVNDYLFIVGLIAAQGIIAIITKQGRMYRATFLTLVVAALTLTLFQIFGIHEGRVVFTLIPPLHVGAVTDVGLIASLRMSLRMIASVGAIPLMLALTPSTQVVSLVSGTFRLPGAYTCMLVTALRFIPTFGERMKLVLQAEAARGYRADTANPFRKFGMVLRLSLPLLVTCARDVDNLSLSLEVRGFDPRSKVRPEAQSLRRADWAMLSVFVAAASAFVLAGKFLGT
jgi:energy-coupling factor transport system permease protein